MNSTIKVVIVDDHPLIIEGLQILFSNSNVISITNSFSSASEFFEKANFENVDLILLDVFLPDMNGIDVCIEIKKEHPHVKVLAMSSQAERSIILQMIRNGASGYLLKSAGLGEFKYCIENALNGKIVFSDEVNNLVSQITSDDLQNIPRLTKREKEITILMKQGKSTQEIADLLFLSYLTVQTHRRNLLHKFKVKNGVELINYAINNGLI